MSQLIEKENLMPKCFHTCLYPHFLKCLTLAKGLKEREKLTTGFDLMTKKLVWETYIYH